MIAAIVLAAGLSRRMGESKLLLPLAQKPLVRHAVEAVLPHVDDVVVVTGPDDAPVRAALDGLRVRFAMNEHPERGQGTSIATGARALRPDTTAAVVILGDQPRLDPRVVSALLDAFADGGKLIVAPVYQGVQGNPVLFAATVFHELAMLSGDEGARSIVRRDPARVAFVSFDVAMPHDVDTPDDYRRLLGRDTDIEQVQ